MAEVEESSHRARWDSRFAFLAASIGSAVGLGNIWRFPYLCARWGGGAFLLPYFLALFLIGHPILLLELAMGQRYQSGDIDAFGAINKRMRGIGLASIFGAYSIVLYYCVVIAWSAIYLVESAYTILPYAGTSTVEKMSEVSGTCLFNSTMLHGIVDSARQNCIWDKLPDINKNTFKDSITCDFALNNGELTVLEAWSELGPFAITKDATCTYSWYENITTSNAETHFYGSVLQIAPSIDQSEYTSNQSLVLSLIFIYICIFLSVFRGVKSASKVVLITMPLPFLLLIALFFNSIFLDGAKDGLIRYATMDASYLGLAGAWSAAVGQVFFSLGVCMGVMTAYSSYNPTKQNVIGDNHIIAAVDTLTSLFGGCVVYSVLGFLAKTKGTDDVFNSSGPGLTFIAYPEALSQFPELTGVWGVLFFLCLTMLGIDSAFSLVEAFATVITDRFGKGHQSFYVFMISVVGCVLGINLFTTDIGLYNLDIVDHYINEYGMIGVGMLECITVGWLYNNEGQIQQAGRQAVYLVNGSFMVVTILATIFALMAASPQKTDDGIQYTGGLGNLSVHFALWSAMVVWLFCTWAACIKAERFRHEKGLKKLSNNELMWLLCGWHGPEMLRATLNQISLGHSIKVKADVGINVFKEPILPGYITGLTLKKGTIEKYDELKLVEYNGAQVEFYRLVGKPGWVTGYTGEDAPSAILAFEGTRDPEINSCWDNFLDWCNTVGPVWGFLIKYIIPPVLFLLLCSSIRQDFTEPYGGYAAKYQARGIIFIVIMILMIVLPMIEPDLMANKVQEKFVTKEQSKGDPTKITISLPSCCHLHRDGWAFLCFCFKKKGLVVDDQTYGQS